MRAQGVIGVAFVVHPDGAARPGKDTGDESDPRRAEIPGPPTQSTGSWQGRRTQFGGNFIRLFIILQKARKLCVVDSARPLRATVPPAYFTRVPTTTPTSGRGKGRDNSGNVRKAYKIATERDVKESAAMWFNLASLVDIGRKSKTTNVSQGY